mgnify:CR=1 FL=1
MCIRDSFKSCDVSPDIAATIQITDPTTIVPVSALLVFIPDELSITPVIISVAIAIPDTGLLLLPTSPTILDDTVAKKKPNTTIRIAPGKLIGNIKDRSSYRSDTFHDG